MSRKLPPLTATIVPIPALSPGEVRRMFDLMVKYYENVDRAEFDRDLAAKDHVIVLRNSLTGYIEGFSTLRRLTVEGRVRGRLRPIRGIFSGDTIVERSYWGDRTLGKAFLRYLLAEKLKHPFEPLYWYLISKGYKTYMLMANNFREHWPRFERETPAEVRDVMDSVYEQLFPGSYEADAGLVVHKGPSCRLKPGVAPPTESLRRSHPRVDFFDRINPEWAAGTELCCLARMTVWMPVYYSLKALWRAVQKRRRRAALQPAWRN